MGKDSSRKVYDYLMSVDYGVCHGPVDHFNMVWVKDKPIWCGRATEAQTEIDVNRPELFGGDDAEGGVVGTVELYRGDDDQTASSALAARSDRTPSNMPGYRGLAHLFFRGRGSNGFRWGSNNPYMAAAKVSATRLPVTPSGDFPKIMPPPNLVVPLDGFEVTDDGFSETKRTVSIDLENVIPLDEVDTGSEVRVHVRFGVTVATTREENPGELDRNALLYFSAAFFGVGQIPEGGLYYDEIAGERTETSDGPFRKIHTYEGSIMVPHGTRRMELESAVVVGSYGEIISVDEASAWLTKIGDVCPTDGTLGPLPDANPAYMIFECLTNEEWGKGEPIENIDMATIEAAASTLHAERFGLSMLWTRTEKIERFVQEILDHIQGFLFVHPATGLWTLTLLRGGYSTDNLPVLSPENCVAKNRKRKGWGETVNEVVVTWTDPKTEKEASVTAHNLANIAIQGGVISDQRNYYGVRNGELAQKLANRDVEEAGYPLFSSRVEVDRTAWTIVPGSVCEFRWPEDEIEGMIVRVMAVDYGTSRDRKIKLDIVEDIFALDRSTYAAPQQTEWVSDDPPPEPLTHEFAMETPLPVLLREGISLAEIDENYPAAAVTLVGGSVARRVHSFDVWGEAVKANGDAVTRTISTAPTCRVRVLGVDLPEEAFSVLPADLVSSLLISGGEGGDFLLIGDGADRHEIVMLDSIDEATGGWTVARGIHDTIPRAWSIIDPIWSFPDDLAHTDGRERAVGETVTYRFLTRTRLGTLDPEDAAEVTETVGPRIHAPFRPANTQIGGAGFGVLAGEAGATGTVEATWATRDRRGEDRIAVRWDEGPVTPEPGQTTVLRILDSEDTLIEEVTGLTGNAHALDAASLAAAGDGVVEFVSERDGIRSVMNPRRAFDFRASGYGFSYGGLYGGRAGAGGGGGGDLSAYGAEIEWQPVYDEFPLSEPPYGFAREPVERIRFAKSARTEAKASYDYAFKAFDVYLDGATEGGSTSSGTQNGIYFSAEAENYDGGAAGHEAWQAAEVGDFVFVEFTNLPGRAFLFYISTPVYSYFNDTAPDYEYSPDSVEFGYDLEMEFAGFEFTDATLAFSGDADAADWSSLTAS